MPRINGMDLSPITSLFASLRERMTSRGRGTTAAAVPASVPAGAAAGVPGFVPPPVHQLVDQTHVAAAGAAAGAWWYLQAGASVTVQVAAGPDGTSMTPVVSDSAGAWLDLSATDQPGAATVVIPSLGWFLLGAWNAGAQDAPVTMRFTLPLDAQPAPEQQAQ
jgi:hypothetical protein